MISFTAAHLNSSKVITNDVKGMPQTHVMNFFELMPKSEKDAKTIDDLTKHWACDDTLLLQIKNDFWFTRKANPHSTKRRFFIITEQKDATRTIDVKDILGIAQTSQRSKKYLEIDYFQTKPKELITKEKNSIEKIGIQFINLIKNIYKESTIWLYSTKSSAGFYRKAGFKQAKQTTEGLSIMVQGVVRYK